MADLNALRFGAAYDPVTAEITLRMSQTFWDELPSNVVDFTALTTLEEGRLRSLLAALWLAASEGERQAAHG